jgi:hypothetical protein
MWADPSAPKAVPGEAGDDDPSRVPPPQPPAYFTPPYGAPPGASGGYAPAGAGGYAPAGAGGYAPQPPAYGVQPVAQHLYGGGGDPMPYWQQQQQQQQQQPQLAPMAVAVPLMPPPQPVPALAPGGEPDCCHSDDDDSDSDGGGHGGDASRRERRRRRRAQRERDRGSGRRPCLALPLLLAHNLLHWALVVGGVAFVVHTKEMTDPLCDMNGCGMLGCDFPGAKCSTHGYVITDGIATDGFTHACCAAKGDVPFVTAATVCWSVGVAACVLGAVGAVFGPLLARARLRWAAGRTGSSAGADTLHARDALVSPPSLRLPIVGAAYAFSHMGAPQIGLGGNKHGGSGGAIGVDGSVLLASVSDGGGGGFVSPTTADDAAASDAPPRKPRAGSGSLLRVLSLTLLYDSLVRDLLLLGAAGHWVLAAEPAWAASSAEAHATDDDATSPGGLQWRGPASLGTWLAAGAAASLATTLALRSWAVASTRG